jgi:hypothetical protein
MLNQLGMQFEGRPHCGMDDARNIARILIRLAADGGRLLPNERICLSDPPGGKRERRVYAIMRDPSGQQKKKPNTDSEHLATHFKHMSVT